MYACLYVLNNLSIAYWSEMQSIFVQYSMKIFACVVVVHVNTPIILHSLKEAIHIVNLEVQIWSEYGKCHTLLRALFHSVVIINEEISFISNTFYTKIRNMYFKMQLLCTSLYI